MINTNKISFKRQPNNTILVEYEIPITSFKYNIDEYKVSLILEKKQESRLSNSNIRKKDYKDIYNISNDKSIIKKISNLLSIESDYVKLQIPFVDITLLDTDGYIIYIPYLITSINIDSKEFLRDFKINKILILP